MGQKLEHDMTDSIFETLFGKQWDEMFLNTPSFFGKLFEHVNNFAVSLIVIITIISIIGGLIRTGQKREFLGQSKLASFWVIRLVLFVGCCYPALHGYSIAQGVLLKFVRYGADVGNTISVAAFDTMANTGMLPIGDVMVKPDNTLMYRVFDSAVCHAYMRTHLEKKDETNPTPIVFNGSEVKGIDAYYDYEWLNEVISLNTIDDPDKPLKSKKQAEIAILDLRNRVAEKAKTNKGSLIYGAKWGGLLGSVNYPTNACGQILYVCNTEDLINDEAINKNDVSDHEIRNEEIKELLDTKISAEKTEEVKNLRDSLRAEALNYCNSHGKMFVRKIESIQSIANSLVSGNPPKRGELQKIQLEYELETIAVAKNLNAKVAGLIKEKIGNSDVAKQVANNGFIMLGFYYYQLTSLIDDARDAVTISPDVILPDYDKIDPNKNEAKGLASHLAMAEAYRNSTIQDCPNSQECDFENNLDKYAPEREENYVMKKMNPYLSPSVFDKWFVELDPDRPVGSIMELGNKMITTGTVAMSVFVAADIMANVAVESGPGKALNWFTGLGVGIIKVLSWMSVPVISFCVYLLTCGMFLLFVIPTIPLITWLFAIFAWIIIVIETIVAIPLWAVAASTSTGDGFVADTGRTGITLLLNAIIRPILLPIFFFAAIVLAVIFSRLIIVGIDIFMDGQLSGVPKWSPALLIGYFWKIFLVTYLFVMAFKLSHEIMAKGYDYAMRFVNSSGRADYGTEAPNNDMMQKGLAAVGVAGSAATGTVKLLKQSKEDPKTDKSVAKPQDHPPPSGGGGGESGNND